MSLYSLPLVIFNLGGEMFYVLEQRLKAQHVPDERARKILDEIATVLLNEVFIHEIFKPQPLYCKQELYLLFRGIAHGSIIKLSDSSMGKLYDLMTMVFKYQLYSARQPREILLITLNHLNSLRNFVLSPNVFKELDSVYYLFMKTYYSMYDAELQRIRYDLLNYFQDIHIKVSICLRLGLQNGDGTFVDSLKGKLPYGQEIPGIIKYLNVDESISDMNAFPLAEEYVVDQEKPCFELRCPKGTSLGTSIYQENSFSRDFSWTSADNLESQFVNASKTSDYRSEMETLLNQLLGNKQQNADDEENREIILLDLFADDEHQNRGNIDCDVKEPVKTVTLCDMSDMKENTALETAACQMTVNLEHSDEKDNDLLYLLENL